MPGLVLSLTNAGLAAVQGASGADPVIITELGLTATPFDIAPTLTALPGEFKRIAAVSGAAVADNVTHMSAYDTSADVWNATGLGLWLADGTLFAIFSSPTTILNKAGPAFALVAFDIAWQAELAGSIAFGDPIFTNPPATEDARGLIELATQAEASAGGDALRAVTPATGKTAVTDWLLGRSVLLGVADVATPDAGTSGGLRLRGNGITGFGYLQVLNHDASAQWGYWRHSAGGEADWHGAGGLKVSGNIAWHAGNDGAGSGSDADLLDGQHGSWYADIPARLGYTPLDSAAYTAASVLARLVTVDGAGSGLDADLLDGQQLAQIAPAGIIVMWSGAVGAVPAGWALCDGANGTPDLRGRFIVGAGGTYAVGATGGAAEHQHSIEVQAATTGITISTTTVTVNGDGDPPNALTSATPVDPQHTHTATSGLADSRPPYFALAYIMKL